jgi:hypothetical protein
MDQVIGTCCAEKCGKGFSCTKIQEWQNPYVFLDLEGRV